MRIQVCVIAPAPDAAEWLSNALTSSGKMPSSATSMRRHSGIVGERWINLNVKVFKETGKLMEKYDVKDVSKLAGGGEYPGQDGFGWTNGVLLKLISIYGLPSGGEEASH